MGSSVMYTQLRQSDSESDVPCSPLRSMLSPSDPPPPITPRSALLRLRKRHPRISLVCVFVVVFTASATISFFISYHALSSPSPTLPAPFLSSSKPLVPPGWRLFTPSPETTTSALYVLPRRVEPTRAQRIFSSRCADLWISKGRVCPSLASDLARAVARGDDGAIDVLWTWVNGSDAALTAVREDAASERLARRAPLPKVPLGDAGRHFRDRNELLYSMRSVLSSLPRPLVRKLHLFTASLPLRPPSRSFMALVGGRRPPPRSAGRIGQVPTWLREDFEDGVGGEKKGPRLRVHHHWEAARVTEGVLEEEGFKPSDTGSLAWREKTLPTFNSFSIESQIPHIQDLKDTMVDFNDDFFMLRNLSAGDLSTVLYGPVFRIQPDLHVSPHPWPSPSLTSTKPSSTNPLEGEWPALGYTNLLLSRRFGARDRRYLIHVAKVFEVPVMREFVGVWRDEVARTAGVRFRGRREEVYAVWGAVWYHIERHREALLHSFVMLKSDRNRDDVLSPDEQSTLLRTLGTPSPDPSDGSPIISVPNPLRTNTTLARFTEAGLPPPLETNYTFASSNGYPLAPQKKQFPARWPDYHGAWPFTPAGAESCVIDVEHCFPPGFGGREGAAAGDVEAEEVFKRIAFEKPECGDCMIVALLGRSGSSGLEAFLPPPVADPEEDDRVAAEDADPQPLGGYDPRWESASFSPSPRSPRARRRAAAVSRILRYSYVLGDSATQFLSIKYEFQTRPLAPLRNATDPCALLAVNDDAGTSAVVLGRIAYALKEFFEARWPDGGVRGWWEKGA